MIYPIETLTGYDTVAPTVDTNAYTAGDLVGTKLEFEGLTGDSLTARIDTLVIRDLAKQSAALNLVLFSEDPSATTFTNNAAFDVADADLAKVIGHVPIAAGDYCALADNSFATVRNIGLRFHLSGTSRKLYGALVAVGTPTFAAATDVSVTLATSRDN